MLINLSLIHEA
ncbi:hypothetical protein YPPY46_4779, partial [Yersinia pestis PY-46]